MKCPRTPVLFINNSGFYLMTRKAVNFLQWILGLQWRSTFFILPNLMKWIEYLVQFHQLHCSHFFGLIESFEGDFSGWFSSVCEWSLNCIQVVSTHGYDGPFTSDVMVKFVLQVDETEHDRRRILYKIILIFFLLFLCPFQNIPQISLTFKLNVY